MSNKSVKTIDKGYIKGTRDLLILIDIFAVDGALIVKDPYNCFILGYKMYIGSSQTLFSKVPGKNGPFTYV